MTTQTALVPTLEEAEPAQDPNLPDVMGQLASTAVDDVRNWATDPSVIAYLTTHVFTLLPQIRTDMVQLHEEWRAIARMTTLQHDSGQRYRGRSNAYIPSYAKARKTLISVICQGLFPSDEYMSVSDRERPSESVIPDVLATKQWLQYQLEKIAKIRQAIRPWVGQLVDYGFAVGKAWYEKGSKGRMEGRRVKGGGTTMEPKRMVREGMRFSARNILDWYVYPYFIDDLDEATLIFEDIDVPRSYILERERTKEWENCKLMLDAPEVSEHTLNKQELQSEEMAGVVSSTTAYSGSDIGDIRTVTEIWCELVLPDPAYLPGEIPGTPVPCRIVVGGEVIAQVVRNPFWTQKHPYFVERDDPKPGSFFSKGTGHLVTGIQYLINDFVNQTNDNGIMGLNPTTIYNPATLAGPLNPFKPGGLIATTDPSSIKFDRPPIEQVQYGMNLIQMFAAMLGDFSGAPPIMQGTKGGSTATTSQVLQKNALNPLKDLVEGIEQSLMVPLLHMTWVCGQQYCDEKFMLEVMGDTGGWSPKSMTRDQLIGDYIFQWLASSQAANAAQRAEQGMKLLAAITPLVDQMLQRGGNQVDPLTLLERIFKDSLGFRDFSKFIKPLPPQPGEPQVGPDGQPMPPGQGASMPGGGNDARSAVEQSGNPPDGAGTMAPGEGDELLALRKQVESQTADQGEG